jgi:hypothetical protein
MEYSSNDIDSKNISSELVVSGGKRFFVSRDAFSDWQSSLLSRTGGS